MKAYGKTTNEAINLFNDIKDIENTGAWGVEVECIPSDLMGEITKNTSLVTISIGSGNKSDVQFLFAEDILGNNGPPYPRHSKQYREMYKLKEQMQKERVEGFKDFIKDVQEGNFPKEQHVIKAPDGLIDSFLKALKEKN